MPSRPPRRQPASTWLPLRLVTTGRAHVQFAKNRGSALPRMGSVPSEPALKGTGVSGDRLGYVLRGRWPTGHPFLLCHAGLGSAEETQDRKRSSSPHSTMVSNKIVFLYYYFINLDFFWVGVELSSLKHQGHRGHTREITSLVLFEWLRG